MNYTEHIFILISTVTGCVSISAFGYLFGIPTGIISSAIGVKICVIIAGIKKYKSVFTKIYKKHYKILLLAKPYLKSVKSLIDSNISHHDFVLIINVSKEFDNMKEEIKNSNDK